jgi:hypothetical protein
MLIKSWSLSVCRESPENLIYFLGGRRRFLPYITVVDVKLPHDNDVEIRSCNSPDILAYCLGTLQQNNCCNPCSLYPLLEDLMSPELNLSPQFNDPVKSSSTKKRKSKVKSKTKQTKPETHSSIVAMNGQLLSYRQQEIAPEMNVTWILSQTHRPNLIKFRSLQLTSRPVHKVNLSGPGRVLISSS